MTPEDKVILLRRYAAGDINWQTLRERGIDNYLDVLGGLGNLGLRPPVAAMEGPNVEIRQRARALLRGGSGAGKAMSPRLGREVAECRNVISWDGRCGASTEIPHDPAGPTSLACRASYDDL